VPGRVAVYYESAEVPVSQLTEKKVYHRGQFFRKLKPTLQSQKVLLFSAIFNGKFSEMDDKTQCPLNRGHKCN
jgi:hypothetical protein